MDRVAEPLQALHQPLLNALAIEVIKVQRS